ncbi:MAG: hypothetical protein LUI14_06840, partial [Lachnospiraceae bacterium]|nr:hypothetical protein [Lachnospiraceae bacterium]
MDNLAEGKYYVLEVLSDNPYGMDLVGNNSIVVEVTADNSANIPVAEFTNNLTQTGSLKITKNVTVNGEPATKYDDPTVADGNYTFYIIQESTGITKADRTITIENGVSVTEQVDNLEPGWYIVREYLSGNPKGMTLTSGNDVRVYVYGDNKDDAGNTVINVAEFTNNKTEVGSLAITKSVTVNGDPASAYSDPTVADGTYTFYIVDENNNEVARTTAVIFNGVSSTVQVDNLKPGIYYVYEELTSNPSGMTLTSGNGKEVTVTANNTANIPTVEFVNNLEQVGSLKIKKNVTINGEDPADASDPTAADGTYTFYVVDSSNNEVARKTLTIDGGVSTTVEIDNLEPGVYYVYEYLAGNPSGVTLTTANGVQVTVEADNTANIPVVSFTNDVEDVGSLKITKNVTINGMDPTDSRVEDVTAADGTYTFYVVDESNNEVARRNITIVNGESNTAQIDNLVPGVYYVYEYLAGNPSGVTLTTANGVQVTVEADNTANIPVVSFTNDVEDVGSLKITKNVTINGMDPTDSRVEDATAADGTYTFYVVDENNNEVARRNITIVNGESNTAQIDNLVP